MSEVGRNDPCPCNSGLKYKHCCLEIEKKWRLKKILRHRIHEAEKGKNKQYLRRRGLLEEE